MRWTKSAVGLVLLLAAPTIVSAQQATVRKASAQGGRPVHQEYDPATDTMFSSTTDSAGNAVLGVKVGDFVLEKVLAASGDMTLRLAQGKDAVTIAVNQSGYQVARGKRSARFDPRSSRADQLDAIRTLLLGSKAVRTFRRLTAALEDRDEQQEDGPLVLSALVDGAIVHMLDGDSGAPKRIAKRITRKRRVGIQLASAGPHVMFRDCIGMYEVSLVYAWDQYFSCWIEAQDYSWWWRDFIEGACEFEWLIRTQQYLWQFTGCLAFPF